MASVVRWLKSSQSQAIELSPLRKQNDVAEDSGDEFDHGMDNASIVSLKHTEGKLMNTTARRASPDTQSRQWLWNLAGIFSVFRSFK